MKFIFITILIIWLIRRFGGFVLKSWFTKQMTKQQAGNSFEREEQRRPDGDVFISKNKTSNGQSKSDAIGGDYVDFEEVD